MQSLPCWSQTRDSQNQGDSDRFNLQPATNWLLSQLSVVQWRKPASTFSWYSFVSPPCLCFSSIPCSSFLDFSTLLHVLTLSPSHFLLYHLSYCCLFSFTFPSSLSPSVFWCSSLKASFFSILSPYFTFFDPFCFALLESSSQLFLSQHSLSSLSFRSLTPFSSFTHPVPSLSFRLRFLSLILWTFHHLSHILLEMDGNTLTVSSSLSCSSLFWSHPFHPSSLSSRSTTCFIFYIYQAPDQIA